MVPTVLYRRATFATQLPLSHLYTPSHGWLAPIDGSGRGHRGRWRVGYTKFALRMLGELVEVQLDRPTGSEVQVGDILGVIEGFKALSDVYCVGQGRFLGMNSGLSQTLESVADDPYETGWIYEFEGTPDDRVMDVDGYRGLLDATIDRMLEKQNQ